jgi:hypothetical protein
MKKTSIKNRKYGSRIMKLLSSALIPLLLLAAIPVSIPARAAQGVTYKLEVTTESQASGWNKATLKIGYKSGGSSDNLDIKDELSEGKKMEWTFVRSDAVPYHLQMYLDFGGGFTVALCIAFLKMPEITSLFRTSSDSIYLLTAFFALFIFASVFNCFCARSDRLRLLANITKNKAFIGIMGAILFIQILFIYLGGNILRTAPLSVRELSFTLLISLLVFPSDMLRKLLWRLIMGKKGY